MTQKTPILSICIPTFNRADTLKKNLQLLTSDPYFQRSDLVEIVISDNCSSDHTAEVAKSYTKHFPNKVTYHRTTHDLAEGNFEFVLRKGRGTFRKLQNDSFGIQNGVMEALVKIISSLQEKKPVIFFVNEEPKSDEDTLQNFDSMDGFLNAVSYKCTWIGGFGIWADDLKKLTDFSRAIDLHLTQTDVLLRMVAHKKNAVVIQELMQPCFLSGRKRGYNIAEVFGANYLSILKKHVASGSLSQEAYKTEKKRVLLEHTLQFVFNKHHDFLNDNLMHHLRDYVGEPYFMPALESAQRASRPDAVEPKTPKTAESFSQQWRNANLHNETICTHPIPLQKVSVGRRTYGAITAMHWGHPDEFLKIGSFCSIGGGVEFMLGGNHAMDGLSTFPVKVKYLGHAHEALTKGPIVVGDDVWIGNRATILSGTHIGQGAVIGACAVVSGHVPPYAVVAGNPARIVRYRYNPELIEKMLELNYDKVSDASILAMGERMYEPLTMSNVEAFVLELMSSNSDKENSIHLELGVPESQSENTEVKVRSDQFNLFKKKYDIPSGHIKIAFIGNSITLHGPATEIGWINNNGMAASAIEDDYCHSLLGMLEIPTEHAFIMNFAEAEREDIVKTKITHSIYDLFIEKKPLITVIQLGDNVSNEQQFKYFHDNLQLLASIAKKNSEHVILLSTWWESTAKDRIIKEIADSTEASYIYIGDLFNSPHNVDREKKAYDHTGVNNHPRDWGMIQIAERIHSHLALLPNLIHFCKNFQINLTSI